MASRHGYSGRYIVVGPPGTGKTHYLRRQVEAIVDAYSDGVGGMLRPNPVMACSLTKAAAAELVDRVDLPRKKQMVGTLHSHAYRAIGSPRVIGATEIAEWNAIHPPAWALSGAAEVDLDETPAEATSKPRIKRPGAEGQRTPGDERLARVDLRRHKLVPRDHWPAEMLDFADAWSEHMRECEAVDFTGMLEDALNRATKPSGDPAVLMVDEAQDLSLLEHALVDMWGQQCDAIFLVGDPDQSLYEWRGADTSIFGVGAIEPERRKVLGRSHRVPEAVVDTARSWISDRTNNYDDPEYAARSPVSGDDPPGGLATAHEAAASDAARIAREIEHHAAAGRSVMYQAACDYMVQPIVAELRELGVPFSHPWKRKRSDWNPLHVEGDRLTKCARALALLAGNDCMGKSQRDPTLRDLGRAFGASAQAGTLVRGAKAKLAAWAKLKDEGNRPAAPDDYDTVFLPDVVGTALRATAGAMPAADAVAWWVSTLPAKEQASNVTRYIVRVVARGGVDALLEPPHVHAGTIHSFKGAEADVVFVSPDLSPKGYANWCDEYERAAVVRLFYVAMTRARHRLYVLRNSTPKCAPLWSHTLGCERRRDAKPEVDGAKLPF